MRTAVLLMICGETAYGQSAVTDIAADADQVGKASTEAFDEAVDQVSDRITSSAAAAYVVGAGEGGQQPFVVEDMDYPGADAGVLVDMPRAAVGTVPGYDVDIIRRSEEEYAWPIQEMAPYYEWAVAQVRGNRYALPEPDVQQLERLNKILYDTVSELRRLGDATVANAAVGSLDSIAAANGAAASGVANGMANGVSNGMANGVNGVNNGLALDPASLNNLINTVSGSLSNVAQAAGQAVGVSTTPAAPINQAVLGLLNILQGFQKLAIAVGSIPVAGE